MPDAGCRLKLTKGQVKNLPHGTDNISCYINTIKKYPYSNRSIMCGMEEKSAVKNE
jgi:hypothetical protein